VICCQNEIEVSSNIISVHQVSKITQQDIKVSDIDFADTEMSREPT